MSDYTNKGILFKNDYKKDEKHPDYKGKINIEGKEYELASWVRKGDKGSFMSLSVSEPYNKDVDGNPKNQQQVNPTSTPPKQDKPVQDEFDEPDLPF